MSKIDDLITETLREDQPDTGAPRLPEPGYFTQAMALFTGKLGWVMWFVGIIQLIFFVGAIYAFVQLFGTENTADLVRWGVITIALVQLSTFLRGFMGSHFEANRVLHQLARLELRLEQSREDKAAGQAE